MPRHYGRTRHRDVLPPRVLEAYGQWVCRLLVRGFDAYLLTLEFKPIRGGRLVMLDQMKQVIALLYSRMATDIVRIRARRRPPITTFPLLIASPDAPVGKRNKSSSSGARSTDINGGTHFHIVVVIPAPNILKTSFDQYLAQEHARLVKDTIILGVHATRITSTPADVVRYVMKSLERLRFCGDDILVLPKVWSEMLERPGGPLPSAVRDRRKGK